MASWPETIAVTMPDGRVVIAHVSDVSEPVNIGDAIQYTITARMFPTSLEYI